MSKLDNLSQIIVTSIACLTLGLGIFFILYMMMTGLPIFTEVSVHSFLFGTEWAPEGVHGSFGLAPMIAGSLCISLLAILLALPIGVGCSVYVAFFMKKATRKYTLVLVDMFAGMPSVILGFVGLVLLVRAVENVFALSSGESVLAGTILLALMSLPYIVTNCVETMEAIADEYEATAFDLGVSKEYFIWTIVLPQSRSAIWLSVILAFARAMGETMAVMMVIGNAPIFPTLLGKAETIPALLALEMGNAPYESVYYHALYGASLLLFVILLVCNAVMYVWRERAKR